MQSLYQPYHREGAFSSSVGGKLYMWGGRTGDYNKKAGVTQVDVLDSLTEKWLQHTTKGHLPTGLHNGSTASVGRYLYGYALDHLISLVL